MRLFRTASILASVASLCAAQAANNTDLPVNYGMIIFPNFQTLDVFGPLEVLNGLSRYFRMNLRVIAPSMNLTSQSPTSPAMNTTGSNFSYFVKPTHTFDNPPDDLEVLIIPGGGWTRSPDVPPVLDYVAKVFPNLKYLITVCTGSMIAARAGVLDGKNATTNKAAWKEVTSKRAEVNWIPKARWVVDGNIWTTSGISAGIDGTLAFVSEIYGKNYSEIIATKMEYEAHTDPNWDPWADFYNLTKPEDTTTASFLANDLHLLDAHDGPW